MIKQVGILYHPMRESARSLAKELREFIGAGKTAVWLCSAWDEAEARPQMDGTDLILTIGGDGTILRAAQVVIPRPIPMTGVNMGTLGFMTELRADEARGKLPALLSGEGWIDERALLEAELPSPDKGPPRRFHALNDVVVARGAIARVIKIEASIDGEQFNSYRADGIILSTATGSTGYALAAGGPILYPQEQGFLMLPVVPHLTSRYPVVLPPQAVVALQVSTFHQATMSVDGHINMPLDDGAIITIKRSMDTVRFLRISPQKSFYATLEQKLKGRS